MSPVDLSHVVTGSGPALLLLHGFPQTRLMWRELVPVLAEDFTVVCADLRGYGDSECPPSDENHDAYSKRTMASDVVELMTGLGHQRFGIVGHDRGGRVAYRTALDHPGRVERLAVLDVLPIDVSWELADARLALGFWPWSLLAQPEPLPEQLLGAAAEAVLDHVLGGAWGTPAATFDASVRQAYLRPLRDPVHVHAICEEYRAAATIDRQHDTADRDAARRIACPVLALWSESGPLSTWYTAQGGPLALWQAMAPRVQGGPVPGGHFFPEEHPHAIARRLRDFFTDSP